MTTAKKLIEKGEKLGRSRTAQNALKAGLDVKTVKKITGLSKQEIEEIRRKLSLEQ